MLNGIKKLMGAPQADVIALQAEFDGYKETAEALLAQAQAEADEMVTKLAALEAKLSEYTSVMEAEKLAALAAAEDAAVKKQKLRQEKLEHAVGSEKAEAMLVALGCLSDGQFDVVVSGLAKSFDDEAKSPLFQEAGIEGNADAANIVQESPVMTAIREKYKATK